MSLTIDSKKILADVGYQTDRTKVSCYLSKSLYDDFKRSAGAIPASQVVQRLMKLFVEDAMSSKKSERHKK